MAWIRQIPIFLLLVTTSLAILPDEAPTLVLLDNLAIRETHSMFFKSLQGDDSECRNSCFRFCDILLTNI